MILAIDVGNTTTTGGSFITAQAKNPRNVWSINTNNFPKIDSFISQSGINSSNIAIISSVVPKIEQIVKKKLLHHGYQSIYRINKEVHPQIQCKYKNVSKLGADRIANAQAVISERRYPCIVIDFGTAVTMDYISKKPAFEGGLIIPGVETAFQGLQERGALLPKVKLARPKTFVGTTTQEAMLAGIIYGYAAMIDGLVAQFRKRFGRLRTIGTGGFAPFMKEYCTSLDTVDAYLTLKGIKELYKQWSQKGAPRL